MHILGFNCYAHDAAAAIVRDGELLGLIEEERFLRRKHVGDFPRNAIQWCCNIAGIQPNEIDHIVFYWNPRIGLLNRAKHFLKYFPDSISLIQHRYGRELPMFWLPRTLRKEFGITSKTKIHFATHHLCHAASTFLVSPFETAAIMIVDGFGEWDCTWLGIGKGLDLHDIKKQQLPNSLGMLYGVLTEYLGFRFASGEGKVMGLAPYGDPNRYIDIFRDMIKLEDGGGYQLDLSYFAFHYLGAKELFTPKFYKIFGPKRETESEITQHYMDVAAALQKRTEEVGVHMARWLKKETGEKNLCMAGGVCLNSVMNGRILEEAGFENIFIQPAAYDAGTGMGGCYWLWNSVMRQPRNYQFKHAYLGSWYEAEDYKKSIQPYLDSKEKVFDFKRVENVVELAAQMLSRGKIIGWFQDRMEVGPRALGNRSILADPRPSEMKDLLNARIKFRESFRPFAPSVLEEKVGEWFAHDHASPYMILVYDVLPEKRTVVPSITHVDGTGRVQTVSEETNPKFYRLIQEFEKITNVPMVLNTSFNIRGKPIVNRPEEAIECFLRTGMDALFLGDFVLSKKTESAAHEMDHKKITTAYHEAAKADNEG